MRELAQHDAVTCVRGGLAFNREEAPRYDAAAYLDRVVINRNEKIAAAREAMSVINEGDIVFLDSSTTVYELALGLNADRYAIRRVSQKE